MKLNKKIILINISIAIFISTLVSFVSLKGVLEHFEVSGLDLLFQLRGEVQYNPKIIIIEITDADIEKIGRWPWERKWSAAMLSVLNGLGVRSVYFDILFAESSNEEDDLVFEEALKLSKNAAVYLPSAFTSTNFLTKDLLTPLPRFAQYIKGTGAINIYPDPEGTIRDLPLLFKTEKGIFPHLALSVAADYLGLKIKEAKPNYIILTGKKDNLKIPLSDQGEFFINWTGKWQDTFKHYDFLDVLAAYQSEAGSFKANKSIINPDDFKDSICLIGLTAIGLYDIKPTPLEPQYPGVGVPANVISNILDKKFIRVFPDWASILILYILALIASLMIRGEKPFKESFYIFILGCGFFAIALGLFKVGILIKYPVPLLGFFLSYLGVEGYNFIRIAIERKNFFKMAVTDGLTGLYNIRYFKMILEAEITLAKKDPTKKFAVVMSDVDHFKHFNDTYGHQIGDLVLKEIANTLRKSMRISDMVSRYGGEEMIVLLRAVALPEAMSITEKLRKNIENALVKDEKNNVYKVTASLGVSIFTSGDTVDSMIKRADDGLYKSKEGGRNCISTVEKIDTSEK